MSASTFLISCFFYLKIAFATFTLFKSLWSGLQWPEVKGQGSVLRKDFACVWHASHSHLSKPYAFLWPAQQGIRFSAIRRACSHVTLDLSAFTPWFSWKLQLPKYSRINRNYKENCKNHMASWSALEPPSWIRLRGGCLQPPQLSRRLGTLKELWNSLKKLAPALRNLHFACSSWPGTWAPLSLTPVAPKPPGTSLGAPLCGPQNLPKPLYSL